MPVGPECPPFRKVPRKFNKLIMEINIGLLVPGGLSVERISSGPGLTYEKK
jgi:hypothetical protein